ncbi:MAG TPA: FHA domain-containing protein [Fimbriimonas sp.]|nr:FHA domain-containing protein [Fimbriimonas sp.]
MVDEQQNLATSEPEAAATVDAPEAPPVTTPEGSWTAPEPEPMFATLVVKRGGAETDVAFPISSPAIIGRFDPAVGPIDVDLASLPEGSYVSRKHARIYTEDGVWKIQDLGSSNGTFVLNSDFERVTEAELADGKEIALGNARFVFHLKPADTSCPPDEPAAV